MYGLSLFSGGAIGEFAFKQIIPGYRTVGYVEIDRYCRSIIRARIRDGILDDAPIFDDIRTFNARYARRYAGKVDFVSGGFPCQPFSTAKRGVVATEDLWLEMVVAIKTICPEYVFAENVQRAPILTAAHDLWQLGYSVQSIQASASDVGADHIRRRYWLLGYPYNESKSMRVIDDETSRLSEPKESVWRNYPDELRVAHGVASRVDRLKAVGNGWVPQVVKRILRVKEAV